MPTEYSPELLDVLRAMLSQKPEKRPSARRVLCNPFIRKHIVLFLESTKDRWVFESFFPWSCPINKILDLDSNIIKWYQSYGKSSGDLFFVVTKVIIIRIRPNGRVHNWRSSPVFLCLRNKTAKTKDPSKLRLIGGKISSYVFVALAMMRDHDASVFILDLFSAVANLLPSRIC